MRAPWARQRRSSTAGSPDINVMPGDRSLVPMQHDRIDMHPVMRIRLQSQIRPQMIRQAVNTKLFHQLGEGPAIRRMLLAKQPCCNSQQDLAQTKVCNQLIDNGTQRLWVFHWQSVHDFTISADSLRPFV